MQPKRGQNVAKTLWFGGAEAPVLRLAGGGVPITPENVSSLLFLQVTLAKMRSHVSSCAKVQEQMANCPKFVPVVPTSQPIPRYRRREARTARAFPSILSRSPKTQAWAGVGLLWLLPRAGGTQQEGEQHRGWPGEVG